MLPWASKRKLFSGQYVNDRSRKRAWEPYLLTSPERFLVWPHLYIGVLVNLGHRPERRSGTRGGQINPVILLTGTMPQANCRSVHPEYVYRCRGSFPGWRGACIPNCVGGRPVGLPWRAQGRSVPKPKVRLDLLKIRITSALVTDASMFR